MLDGHVDQCPADHDAAHAEPIEVLREGPILIQGVFGILGGIGAHHENLNHMVTIADKLFGMDYHFSAFAAGRHQMNFLTHSALMGGHVRVGLEDNLYIGKGELAVSNAQQVDKAVRIVTELGLEIATPAEAREILGLTGAGAADLIAAMGS